MKKMTKIMGMGAAVLLAGCGGSDDEGSSYPVIKDDETVSTDIQGYYEAVVTADNGDQILINLAVKPNGEYIGLYNNTSVGGTSDYKKEIFSLIAGDFQAISNNKLKTQVREFDSASRTIRNYQATAQYVPSARLTLDLSTSDAAIDKKVYDLNYVAIDSPALDKMTGKRSGTFGTLTKYNFAEAIIANTNNPDIKALQLKIGNTCQFNGTIKDENYRLNYYPYSGTFTGQGCINKGQYSGLMYQLNGIMIIHGTNPAKSDVMRFTAF